jgi:hypothetical protein
MKKENENLKFCLTLYGEINLSSTEWWECYNLIKKIILSMNYKPNYIGIQSKSFKSGKILILDRSEDRLKKALDNGETLDSLDVLSLEPGFKQAAFDYNVSVLVYKDFKPHHITVTVKDGNKFENLCHDVIVEDLKEYIRFESGKIYQLSISEDPLIYVLKGKPDSNVKGLNVIKNF